MDFLFEIVGISATFIISSENSSSDDVENDSFIFLAARNFLDFFKLSCVSVPELMSDNSSAFFSLILATA